MNLPRATYRLQLHRDFGFDAAASIAPYLARLGISHVYTSPFLQARPGSNHGYDIVNHARLNPEVGDEVAFLRMSDAFAANGLRHILDLVPNHMAVGGCDNPLWLDVLEWGQESHYAGWFDIDWESHNRYLTGKVLVPVLGDQYGVELGAGNLRLQFDTACGEFAVWVYDTHKLPICPLNYDEILGDSTAALEALGDDFAALSEWRPDVLRRSAELKLHLARLVREDNDSAKSLEAALLRFNGKAPADIRTALDHLIQQQHWRASHFRVAGDDINYRRFFNVNELAGLRIELPAVFEHTHQLVLDLVRQGRVHGLRVDHVDGLLDPEEYLVRLKDAADAARPRGSEPLYLVVEKILATDEETPVEWPVHGTTGYDFSDLCLQLLVHQAGETAFTEGYLGFIGRMQSFPQVLQDSKLRVMDIEMAAELNVLARAAARVARMSPLTADFTSGLLLRAIRALIACMPVYRTYVHAAHVPSSSDLQRLGSAIEAARRLDREIDPSVFTFLERLLSGQLAEPRSGYVRHKVLWCAMRLQQYSGPVMAKGQEDTAFYRYHRFIALNEVGSDPAQFGIDTDRWHHTMIKRAKALPHTLLTTSTHDTKRGEDMRVRLAVLSEQPQEWMTHVTQWKSLLLTAAAPSHGDLDPNDLYYFMQMLVGSCPSTLSPDTPDDDPELARFRQRMTAAMLKSLREAKVHTTWIRPDESYEKNLLDFVDLTLQPQRCPAFWHSFSPFMHRLARLGVANSLAMVTLKLTCPGIPDIYQGCEGWNFSMMDPDNRRPVDYAANVRQLEALLQQPAAPLPELLQKTLASGEGGLSKLWVTHALLQLRRGKEELFYSGDYRPIATAGKHRHCACVYQRDAANDAVIVVVGRFPLLTSGGWEDTHFTVPALFDSPFTDVLTGRKFVGSSLGLKDLLSVLPVAVLVAAGLRQ